MRQHALTVVYAVFFVSPVLAQGAPELIGSIGDIDDVVLVGIRAAIIQGKAVSILTDPEPAVYVVTFDKVDAWGAKGGGPAESETPTEQILRSASVPTQMKGGSVSGMGGPFHFWIGSGAILRATPRSSPAGGEREEPRVVLPRSCGPVAPQVDDSGTARGGG